MVPLWWKGLPQWWFKGLKNLLDNDGYNIDEDDEQNLDLDCFRIISVLISEQMYNVITCSSEVPANFYIVLHCCNSNNIYCSRSIDIPLNGLKLLKHNGQNYRELVLEMEPNASLADVCIKAWIRCIGSKSSIWHQDPALVFRFLIRVKTYLS